MAELKRNSKTENDRKVRRQMGGFSRGMNVDAPSTEVEDQQVCYLSNYIPKRWLESRPGTKCLHPNDPPGITIPGSGTVHSIAFHNTTKKFLVHRGSDIYIMSEDLVTQTQVLSYDTASLALDYPSSIKQLDNDFVLSVNDGTAEGKLYFINLTDSKFFLMNYPVTPFKLDNGPGTGDYKYRYLTTYLRIEDGDDRLSGRVLQETGSNRADSFGVDYGTHLRATAKSSTSVEAVSLRYNNGTAINTLAGPQHTHIGIYASLDTGVNGIDPISGSGNNPELYVWIADVPIVSVTYTDTFSDEDLRTRIASGLYFLRTRGFIEQPCGELIEVAPGFIFTAKKGDNKLYYSQLTYKQYGGYYSPAYQYKQFDDGITALTLGPEFLTVHCSNRNYNIALNVYRNISDLQTTYVIDYASGGDEGLGVTDPGSFTKVEKASFIGITSDNAVRVWDNNNWGEDLAANEVSKIIRTVIPGRTTSAYFNGAYYLWYSNNQTDTATTRCLRLGLTRDAGAGWTYYTGWVQPPFGCGAFVLVDANGHQKLCVLDVSSSKIYWVETFDGPTGSGLTRVWKDKVDITGAGGTDIQCSVTFPGLKGEEESYNIIHQTTHCYYRPIDDSDTFDTAFTVDMTGYAGGATATTASTLQVPYNGDVMFWDKIEGRRIQFNLTASQSAHRLVGWDAHCRVQDKVNYALSPSKARDGIIQEGLTDSTLWITRGDNLEMDRISGASSTPVFLKTTGPDGSPDSAILLTASTLTFPWSGPTAGVFTLNFWVKKEATYYNPVAAVVCELGQGTVSNIAFTDDNTLVIESIGNFYVPGDMLQWRMVTVICTSSTYNVYTNGVLSGSPTVSPNTVSAGDFILNTSLEPNWDLFDIRVYDYGLEQDMITYLYTNTINHPNKVLPLF